jgi:hypothetical protein
MKPTNKGGCLGSTRQPPLLLNGTTTNCVDKMIASSCECLEAIEKAVVCV